MSEKISAGKKKDSVKIDTVPLPEKTICIGTYQLFIGTWPTPDKHGYPLYIGTWPVPDKKGLVYIGTWPTPEMPAWDQIPRLMDTINNIFKPSAQSKEISGALNDFKQKLCKILEAAIRSDIECLCKYNRPEIDLCTEPKIKECLTRLCITYRLFRHLCCRQ